jgi:probable HAF family extracellular repeat protein
MNEALMTRLPKIAAALVCLGAGSAHAAPYIFTDIVDPSANGSTVASGINDAGQVSGYYAAGDGSTQSFTYQNGTVTPAPVVAGTSFQANGITGAGALVGTQTTSGTVSTVPTAIGVLLTPGSTYLNGVSANGNNFVGYVQGQSTVSGFFGSTNGPVNGVTLTTFTVLGSTNTMANGVNNAGVIAGEYYDGSGDLHGFTAAVADPLSFTTTIDDPLAVFGTAVTGINDNGDLTGFYVDGSDDTHGFVDSGGTFFTIDAPGSDGLFTEVTGNNNSGAIVGEFVDAATGQTVGFEATIAEPVSVSILGMGLLALLGVRRASRSATAI